MIKQVFLAIAAYRTVFRRNTAARRIQIRIRDGIRESPWWVTLCRSVVKGSRLLRLHTLSAVLFNAAVTTLVLERTSRG